MMLNVRSLIATLIVSCVLPGCAAAPASHRADAGERAGASASADTTVILVRHAEKVDESDDAALSDRGLERARWLEDVVRNSGVDTVLVSDKLRTHQTAREVVRAHGLRESQPGDYAAKDTAAAVAAKIRGVGPGHVILVVAHSHQLPDILKELGGWSVAPISDFDRVFVVTLGADGRNRLIRAGYPPIGKGDASGQMRSPAP